MFYIVGDPKKLSKIGKGYFIFGDPKKLTKIGIGYTLLCDPIKLCEIGKSYLVKPKGLSKDAKIILYLVIPQS